MVLLNTPKPALTKYYSPNNYIISFIEKNKSEMEMLKDYRIIYDYGNIIIQKLEE